MIDQESSSTSRLLNPSWCVAGIVILFAGYSIALFWYLSDYAIEWVEPVTAGAWIIQVHMFATWAAIGPGKFLLRLPPVIAVFLIVLGAPAVHPDGMFERGEFLLMACTATGIFAIITVLLIALRRFVGWRIELAQAASQSDASHPDGLRRYQFNTRYLIGLTTLCAVALSIYANIAYEPPDPPPPFNIFGPDFVFTVIVYGGGIAAALLLPVIAVPLFVLGARRSKTMIFVVLGLWLLLTGGLAIFWQIVEEEGPSMLLAAVLLQAGAALMSLFAATLLRLAGYRLVG